MKKLKKLFPDSLTVKKSLYAKKMFGFVAAGAGFVALYQPVEAQIIIQDGFTSDSTGYGTTIDGLSPSGTGHRDLPGGTWELEGPGNFGSGQMTERSGGNGGFTIGTVNDFANIRESGVGAAISLQSSGAYVEPTTFVYSATVNPDPSNSLGTTGPNATVTLGFFTQASASSYSSGTNGTALGLTLDGNGNLSYTSSSGSGLIEAAGTGIFNSSGFTTLSYQLAFNSGTDIATFSNIILNGVSLSGTYTTGALSVNSIQFAGFTGNNITVNAAGAAISSFEVDGVSAAPEPSTYALLAAGVLTLGAYQYRRRQQGI